MNSDVKEEHFNAKMHRFVVCGAGLAHLGTWCRLS